MHSILASLAEYHLIIAIDGYAACGKSTLAKAMARSLKYRYIDSGAMYRAVTLYFIENNVDISNLDKVVKALEHIEIDFAFNKKGNRTILNGIDVEEKIRTPQINELVSPVATISDVRKKLVEQQQEMGAIRDLVMDGRDIGTVVFPNADLKLFVTADIDIRTQRRLKELQEKGMDIDSNFVRNNLLDRDRIDTTREDSPLTQAKDAIILDTTRLTPAQQLEEAIQILYKKVKDNTALFNN